MSSKPPIYFAKVSLWLVVCISAIGGVLLFASEWRRIEPDVNSMSISELDAANLIDSRRQNLISSFGTLATVAGVIGLVWNLRLATHNSRIAEENSRRAEKRLELDTEKIRQDAKQTETRLTAERFIKAIEQLGHESIHVRMGGVYSLEQVANDSPDNYWNVMEVLSAFVREESRIFRSIEKQQKEEEVEKDSIDTQALFEMPSDTETKPLPLRLYQHMKLQESKVVERCANDVQAALDVIGRRDYGKDLQIVNLEGAHLEGANLQGIYLQGANLKGVHLEEAHLEEVNLEGADLSGAHLEGANLEAANLKGAELVGVHLQEANLAGAHLEGAKLALAHLEAAKLHGAHLEGAMLVICNLERADLSFADLRNTGLRDVNLRKAQLIEANLEGAWLSILDVQRTALHKANLEGANLAGCSLDGANLKETSLKDANLYHADLEKAKNLTEAQIADARLCHTKFPAGITLDPNRDCEDLEEERRRSCS
jgi:uncharacterized protein YjbI with pentapeptide repeats